MICSTLSGMMAIKHPTLGVLVREDGLVFNRTMGSGYNKKCAWTNGCLEPSGYRRVRIRGKNYLVHRLLAEAFLPNPENKPTVDHINRVRTDNRICNLHWASYKEQVDNSGKVLNRILYGVRACENRKEYMQEYDKARKEKKLEYNRKRSREYYQSHKEKKLEYNRKRREKKKQEKLASKESQ